jgi:hypothetical protein
MGVNERCALTKEKLLELKTENLQLKAELVNTNQ